MFSFDDQGESVPGVSRRQAERKREKEREREREEERTLHVYVIITSFYVQLMCAFTVSLQADNLTTVIDLDNMPLVISHRLSPMTTPPLEKIATSHLMLQ